MIDWTSFSLGFCLGFGIVGCILIHILIKYGLSEVSD
jgi:hypothetical protein